MASLNHWYSYHLIKMETTTIRVSSNSRVKSCNEDVCFPQDPCNRCKLDDRFGGCGVSPCAKLRAWKSKCRLIKESSESSGDLPDGCTDEDIEDDYARKAGLSAEARSDSKERSCAYDERTKATATCANCGLPLCSSCGYIAGEDRLCNRCYRSSC